ncbi:MAG: acyl-CoA dehydrogenase family protein [Bdellovibrionaceae bacterium]|nr:acyl-CoA dehydrogenase family protein [Pseudobdellovibrionaceae bacterium]
MSADIFNPTQEHSMLREMVRDFAKSAVEPQAAQYDREEKFNVELFRNLGELGLLGITVSEEYGGAGMDATAAVIAHEELAAVDPGFCLAYLAHAMLCVNNFYVNANEEQKQQLLPKMCSGEFVGAMGMSEPDAGTDVLGMSSTAVLKGNDYILNGRKMWITNGCIDDEGTACDGVLVYAKTGSSQNLSTFMVLKEHKGFSVGQKIKDKLGMRASNTAELVFEDCQVPKSWLIGEEGDSMKHMMRNLEIERLTLAAMSLGIARRSLEIMVKYASEREAFKLPLNRFGQIQKYIGDSYAEFKAARAYVYQTAQKLGPSGSGERVDSDGVKLFASTMGKNVSDRAIQVLGGYGYVGEYTVERLWRDAKLLEIGGGTIEAHQKNITRDLSKNPVLIDR